MRRMTRTAVRTPQTASGHISIDIISHLGADLEQTPKLCRCWLWATTDTGKGPSRPNYIPRRQSLTGFVFLAATQEEFRSSKPHSVWDRAVDFCLDPVPGFVIING